MNLQEYVAEQLMKAWFSKRWNDSEWLQTEDGMAWKEISLLDAEVAIKAYEKFYEDDLK